MGMHEKGMISVLGRLERADLTPAEVKKLSRSVELMHYLVFHGYVRRRETRTGLKVYTITERGRKKLFELRERRAFRARDFKGGLA